jgi:hypothetical protein
VIGHNAAKVVSVPSHRHWRIKGSVVAFASEYPRVADITGYKIHSIPDIIDMNSLLHQAKTSFKKLTVNFSISFGPNLFKKRSMAPTPLSNEVIISLVFGIFMAIIALLALWQTAYYAARSMRGLHLSLYHIFL